MQRVDHDDPFEHDSEQTIRRPRRKPRLKRGPREVLPPAEDDRARTTGIGTDAFADPDLQALFDRGSFDRYIGELKGGKEATVYLVARGEQRLAAKLYADIDARSFRDDRIYWEGFYIGDARTAKAMRQGTRAGRRAQQAIWVAREYANLWNLLGAGVPVPRPALGPEPSVFAEAGSVVLMEFIGSGDVPAPRLSDGRLLPAEAEDAWAQSVALLVDLTRLGKVHGDFSSYNLLWHEGRVRLIDVPQMVDIHGNRHAQALLRRDVHSLVMSFRRHRLGLDPREVWAAVERELAGAR